MKTPTTQIRGLVSKIIKLEADFRIETQKDMAQIFELGRYKLFIIKHIYLLERRILKGETIGHEDKLFSIFETYTEWINKGKSNPNVELGKKLSITTDQFNLIVDYQIMEDIADSEIVIDTSARILKKHKVSSWSFDKGYYHFINKELLKAEISAVIMPKKGKCNKVEKSEEQAPIFKKLRNKHSAVESNINELETRGLDRCPDRGFTYFKQYIGVGICAYNLHKIGAEIRRQQKEKPDTNYAIIRKYLRVIICNYSNLK